MGKYTIYRDDHAYPISADTFEELQKLRSQGNHSFMNHYYGSVCQMYDEATHRYKYFNIMTGKEVSASERDW